MDLIFSDFHDQAGRDRLWQIAQKRTSSPAEVAAIVRDGAGQGIQRIARIVQGEASEVYAITTTRDQRIVLRISHQQDSRFALEEWAIQRAREAGIPAPQVIAIGHYDSDQNQTRLSYSIQERLPGRTFDNLVWADRINPERAETITIRAGELLGRLHTISTAGLGRLISPGVGEFINAEIRLADLQAKAETTIGTLAQTRGHDLPPVDHVLARLGEYLPSQAGIQPCLVHSDYAPKHLLVDHNDQIVGVLDFEEAESGDSVQDLMPWKYWFDHTVPVAWLREGHQRVLPLPDDDQRLAYAQLHHALTMLIYFTDQAPHPELAAEAASLIKKLTT